MSDSPSVHISFALSFVKVPGWNGQQEFGLQHCIWGFTLGLQVGGCAWSAAAQESQTSLLSSVQIPKWKLHQHSEMLCERRMCSLSCGKWRALFLWLCICAVSCGSVNAVYLPLYSTLLLVSKGLLYPNIGFDRLRQTPRSIQTCFKQLF